MIVSQKIIKAVFNAIFSAVFFACTCAANADSLPEKNIIKDLHYGEVLFHFFQEDYFTSITHLLASQQLNRVSNHRPDDDLLLGGLDLSYGMHKEAGRIFARLLDANSDDAVKNRAYYYLAKISYQRGYLLQATQYIANIKGAVHEDIFSEVKLLKSQIYLETGQPNKAVAELDRWKAPKEFRAYALHNLGIAHIRNGEVDDGIAKLKKVSRFKVRDSNQRTLRDKTNLVAGLTLIQNKNPEKAQDYLEDIRLSGLYSDISLLSMGWAYSEQGDYEKALTPWLELRNRRLTTTPVQEGLLAIAYGYSQLGLNGRAVKSYEDAIHLYQIETTQLNESIAAIQQGKFISALEKKTQEEPLLGWFWSLKSIPAVPEMRYLSELVADHQFHEAIKNYRDLIFLQNNLRDWLENIYIFNTMLDTRKNRYKKNAPTAEVAVKESLVDRFSRKYDQLQEEYSTALDSDNVLAFADQDEILQLKRIERLQKKVDGLEEKGFSNEDREDLDRRLKMLNGRIYWNASQEYSSRNWQARKNLNQVGAELNRLLAVKDSIGNVKHVAKVGFAGFEYRIDELRARIEKALPRLEVAYKKQTRLLERLAVRELLQRRLVMQSYHAQAKLALAQAYDRATIDTGEVLQ